MPFYDYRCQQCPHTWTEEASIKSAPTTTCPACQKEAAQRLISGSTQVEFRGKGWFKTGGY
jgi:putative FmdB family regulatory protein